MSSSSRLQRQNSGNSSFGRTKPFNDRKRSVNLENMMIAAGVANLRVEHTNLQTNEDAESMLSSRLVTGNLDGSLDEPAIHMQM